MTDTKRFTLSAVVFLLMVVGIPLSCVGLALLKAGY
jgi:hypothetical protein